MEAQLKELKKAKKKSDLIHFLEKRGNPHYRPPDHGPDVCPQPEGDHHELNGRENVGFGKYAELSYLELKVQPSYLEWCKTTEKVLKAKDQGIAEMKGQLEMRLEMAELMRNQERVEDRKQM